MKQSLKWAAAAIAAACITASLPFAVGHADDAALASPIFGVKIPAGGKPVDAAQHETCFACHEAHARDFDFVFTHYAH
jgi:hypothetical protein